MPAPKTIIEDQDAEVTPEINSVENVINTTNYRSEKSRKKKKGHSRAVDDLPSLGLPMLDMPSAGEDESFIIFFHLLIIVNRPMNI